MPQRTSPTARTITSMDTPKMPVVAKVKPLMQQTKAVDLEALSHETGVPVDALRTLAGISDPANEHLFTAESARSAFAAAAKKSPHAR